MEGRSEACFLLVVITFTQCPYVSPSSTECPLIPSNTPEKYICKPGEKFNERGFNERGRWCSQCDHDEYQPCKTYKGECIKKTRCNHFLGTYIKKLGNNVSDHTCGCLSGYNEDPDRNSCTLEESTVNPTAKAIPATVPSYPEWYWFVIAALILVLMPLIGILLNRCCPCPQKGRRRILNYRRDQNGTALREIRVASRTQNGHILNGSLPNEGQRLYDGLDGTAGGRVTGEESGSGLRMPNRTSGRKRPAERHVKRSPIEHDCDLEIDAEVDGDQESHELLPSASSGGTHIQGGAAQPPNNIVPGNIHVAPGAGAQGGPPAANPPDFLPSSSEDLVGGTSESPISNPRAVLDNSRGEQAASSSSQSLNSSRSETSS